jgi:hypothetical protein
MGIDVTQAAERYIQREMYRDLSLVDFGPHLPIVAV